MGEPASLERLVWVARELASGFFIAMALLGMVHFAASLAEIVRT